MNTTEVAYSIVKAVSAPNDDEIVPLSWLFDKCLQRKVRLQQNHPTTHAHSSGVCQSSHLRNSSRETVVEQIQFLQDDEVGNAGNPAGQSVD